MVQFIVSNINSIFNIQSQSIKIELSPSQKLLLAKLSLIGSFYTGNANDKSAVCHFLGCKYDECLNLIEELRTNPDYGIEKSHGVYLFNKRLFMWKALEDYFKEEESTSYIALVTDSLLSFDREEKTSYWLNKGLAQGLQLLNDENPSLSEICVRILRKDDEFSPLSLAADANVWSGIQRFIKDIAIASPNSFLYTFENCQKFNYEIIQNILDSECQFKDETIRSIFCALELLAMDKQYLSRACLIILNAQQVRIGDKDWLNGILHSLIVSALIIPPN